MHSATDYPNAMITSCPIYGSLADDLLAIDYWLRTSVYLTKVRARVYMTREIERFLIACPEPLLFIRRTAFGFSVHLSPPVPPRQKQWVVRKEPVLSASGKEALVACFEEVAPYHCPTRYDAGVTSGRPMHQKGFMDDAVVAEEHRTKRFA